MDSGTLPEMTVCKHNSSPQLHMKLERERQISKTFRNAAHFSGPTNSHFKLFLETVDDVSEMHNFYKALYKLLYFYYIFTYIHTSLYLSRCVAALIVTLD